ncbi:fungal-specific transcription factor domain-containing protein [Zychaea mexicana]|uniref:fungal-specific transcription factor domain-containing protein n=1 Tax=Zychaea mexicana TaxID=64656 RepID=UPI0022FE450B|nr:fungal-specific transcription factor domain-containing protein [Zychaea mexicana]KAI9495060.1 fungal-specific transcription factor domain-containing protein [Zychaea mexicana]
MPTIAIVRVPLHNRQSHFSLNNELEWAESFFAHFNLFFPILSRQHFLHQLQHRPQEMDPLLRCAVLALGCRYAETQSHEDAGAQFFKQCQQQISNTTALSHDNNSTLSTLQAVVIMCWYAYLSGDMQTCRTYLHKQVQLVKDLKLHRDPDLSLGIVTMELRRRAFWVAYVTNQWLACCTGGPLMHQQSYWDCRWPQLEDNQLQAIDSKNLTNTVTSSIEYALQITVFAEMIKLARILDDHHLHSDSSPTRTTTSALTNWFLNLPSYLEYNQPTDHGPPSPIIRVYHMLYYTVQIMLHRALPDTLGVCNTAANTIVHIAEQMILHQQERYLYNTYLLSLSLATSIHLDNAHKAPISLGKSIRVFKNANCTRLQQSDFDSAIDHYLKSECHVSLENEDEQFTQPPVVSKKRKRSTDEISNKSEDGTSANKPTTLTKTTTTPTVTSTTKDPMNELDINDLLGLTGLFDSPTSNNNNNGNDWINNHDWLATAVPMINNSHHYLEPLHQHQQQQDFAFPTIETLSSSSDSLSSPTNSCFSPSHSPTLSCDNTSIAHDNNNNNNNNNNNKNNQNDQTQFLATYFDALPLDNYAWADFIPGENFALMQ